mmetsp:Transcript_13470/g.31639  ORF Transcript_13470/g.31639 Transcript_13470/m.31639 type:complete len:311 (-) Transcript_13470:94-1026(-)
MHPGNLPGQKPARVLPRPSPRMGQGHCWQSCTWRHSSQHTTRGRSTRPSPQPPTAPCSSSCQAPAVHTHPWKAPSDSSLLGTSPRPHWCPKATPVQSACAAWTSQGPSSCPKDPKRSVVHAPLGASLQAPMQDTPNSQKQQARKWTPHALCARLHQVPSSTGHAVAAARSAESQQPSCFEAHSPHSNQCRNLPEWPASSREQPAPAPRPWSARCQSCSGPHIPRAKRPYHPHHSRPTLPMSGRTCCRGSPLRRQSLAPKFHRPSRARPCVVGIAASTCHSSFSRRRQCRGTSLSRQHTAPGDLVHALGSP